MKRLLATAAAALLFASCGAAVASASPDHQDAPHIARGAREVRDVPILKSADGAGLRIGGADRYETAAQLSQVFWDADSTYVVYLASGENYPDALAAGVTAGGSGPLLLVRPNGMVYATQMELMRLQPCVVVVLGGQPSVAQYVMDEAVGYANPNQEKCYS